MNTSNETYTSLIQHFNFTPNADQKEALDKLSEFIHNDENFFILSGSAGTGKTSLVQALTDHFSKEEITFHLAAPTGRAAQVIARKTEHPARTLHSMLFESEYDEDSLQVIFTPKVNTSHDDIRFYVVDESSMISDELQTNNNHRFFQNVTLLSQLIKYAKQGNSSNKIIFVGDLNQLPPVHCDFSPALSEEHLKQKYDLKGSHFPLTIVERHGEGSYILENAMQILDAMKNTHTPEQLRYQSSRKFSPSIQDYLRKTGDGKQDMAIMIALANTQVNALNKWARNFRYQYKNDGRPIMPNELLISNNNTLLDDEVLYKGTSLIVRDIWKPEEFAGLHFINAKIHFENLSGDKVESRTKILLESLTSINGEIPLEDEKKLLHEAFRKNRRFRETKRPADDAFVNAVRPRYGYALTCHKAQGGEWNHVYLHNGYRKDNLRWLYTAVTRAKSELYCISNN